MCACVCVFVGACVVGLRAKGPDTGWARRVFSVSLAYLTLLFAAMVADAV